MLREATVQAGWLVLNEQDHQLHRGEWDCSFYWLTDPDEFVEGFLRLLQ